MCSSNATVRSEDENCKSFGGCMLSPDKETGCGLFLMLTQNFRVGNSFLDTYEANVGPSPRYFRVNGIIVTFTRQCMTEKEGSGLFPQQF